MHNYIPAFSSAFAYAKPGERIVKVEALWGLPEGLYYYSHDKYQVDTVKAAIENSLNSNYKVKTIKNYKKYFVCPMKSGCWEVQTLASPYDWDPAIPKEDWVKEIAYVTRKISEVEKKSVSVMWFVGVDKKRYGCDVFPGIMKSSSMMKRERCLETNSRSRKHVRSIQQRTWKL